MTDRELLEMAAKAAGIEIKGWIATLSHDPLETSYSVVSDGFIWNPLASDSNAFRLAVKLTMNLECNLSDAAAESAEGWFTIDHNGDPYAATRRAIVRAAAEIGRGIK